MTNDATSGHGDDRIRHRDMAVGDVDTLAWIGTDTHRASMRDAVVAATDGSVTYRVAVEGSDIVAYGGIDYTAADGTGTLFQLTVREGRRSEGIGSALITNLVADAAARGCRRVLLHVEDDNPRARSLYERLGYQPCGTTVETWTEEDADGQPRRHTAHCTVMFYELNPRDATEPETRQTNTDKTSSPSTSELHGDRQ